MPKTEAPHAVGRARHPRQAARLPPWSVRLVPRLRQPVSNERCAPSAGRPRRSKSTWRRSSPNAEPIATSWDWRRCRVHAVVRATPSTGSAPRGMAMRRGSATATPPIRDDLGHATAAGSAFCLARGCPLRQSVIAHCDFEHHLLGLGVSHLPGNRSRFLRATAPVVRVLKKRWHGRGTNLRAAMSLRSPAGVPGAPRRLAARHVARACHTGPQR